MDTKINVVILDFDEGKKRIALGLKQLTPHPWDAFDENLKEGDKVKGRVVVVADYGAFVEVIPGVEGLVHVSEMSWSQHLRTAQDFLKVGEIVEAVILTLDRDERKISLGIKQLIPDPWISIAERYTVDSRHTAIVRNFTNFGIFVELEEGVDGLIHISDLSWSKKIKHPAEFTRIGEKMEVIVLEMDAENRRLSLGHKQCEENPWEIFETIYTVGSIHQGTVASQNEKGAMVHLQGVEGFCFYRGLQREDGTNIRSGETEEFKVLEFVKDTKRIVLSHARIWQDIRDAERDAQEEDERNTAKESAKAAKRISDSLEKSTLGDLDALVSLKADLEIEEGKVHKPAKKTKTSKKAEPVVETPIEEIPIIEELPIEEAPVAEIPMEEMPIAELPVVEETPIFEELPVEEMPIEEIPMEEMSVEEFPMVEETPIVEEVPVTEDLTDEPLIVKITIDDDIVVETPIEEMPVEEAPVEEKPKKTRAKKVVKKEEEPPVVEPSEEVKPKKTRAKKAVKEVEEQPVAELFTEEKPKKTRAKKATKEEEFKKE